MQTCQHFLTKMLDTSRTSGATLIEYFGWLWCHPYGVLRLLAYDCCWAFLLENANASAFFELRRRLTEGLNKGGTNVFLMHFHIGATLIEYLGRAPLELIETAAAEVGLLKLSQDQQNFIHRLRAWLPRGVHYYAVSEDTWWS